MQFFPRGGATACRLRRGRAGPPPCWPFPIYVPVQRTRKYHQASRIFHNFQKVKSGLLACLSQPPRLPSARPSASVRWLYALTSPRLGDRCAASRGLRTPIRLKATLRVAGQLKAALAARRGLGQTVEDADGPGQGGASAVAGEGGLRDRARRARAPESADLSRESDIISARLSAASSTSERPTRSCRWSPSSPSRYDRERLGLRFEHRRAILGGARRHRLE